MFMKKRKFSAGFNNRNMDWSQKKMLVALLGFMFFGSVFPANPRGPFHVIIIDAGSTGTRVLAFAFHTSSSDGNLILDSETYHEEKPGLSSYADKPSDGIKSLEILLGKAKSVIPDSEWADTPIFLKATAGLRLLPDSKAKAILEECEKFLKTSGFKVTEKSVSIMEGKDEGIFAWLSANFLLRRFSSQNNESKVVALDLGGGSTQITFAPDDEMTKKLEKDIYKIRAFNQDMRIYTHSYLGLGIMAARKAILVPESATENENGIIEVRSECINPKARTMWTYMGKKYIIQGPSNGSYRRVQNENSTGAGEKRPVVRFKECLQSVQNFTNTIVDKPSGLDKYEIYAISYYFDRAVESGMIDPYSEGNVTVESFYKTALLTCDSDNTEQPFLCLDLTYIYSLLENGLGLSHSTKLNLRQKINGYELSWALGAAFSVLQERI